jgi:hypothetical protein
MLHFLSHPYSSDDDPDVSHDDTSYPLMMIPQRTIITTVASTS